MPAIPKTKRQTDKAYLEYIRTLPCSVCGKLGEPHHTKTRGSGGSDYLAISLCRWHHSECHDIGKLSFQHLHGVDFNKIIIINLIGFIRGG